MIDGSQDWQAPFADMELANAASGATADERKEEKKKFVKSRAEHLDRLGDKIEELRSYVDKTRGVQTKIRDLVRQIEVTYESVCVAQDYVLNCGRDGVLEKATQTSMRTPAAKNRAKETTASTSKNAVTKGKQGVLQSNSAAVKRNGIETPLKGQRVAEERWTKVVGKNTKKAENFCGRRRLGRARPTAVLVKAANNSSYADILRNVKSDPNLKEFSAGVTRIRRNAGGALLFELSKEAKNIKDMVEAVASRVGNEVEVCAKTQRATLVVSDMDEVTTKEELRSALACALSDPEDGDIVVRSLRPAYGNTQRATINLAHKDAAKLLSIGRVRVGWVNCRVRCIDAVNRCFRCWLPDHVAAQCKGKDRRDLCIRCGKPGHIAAICKNPPRCVLCQERGFDKVDHAANAQDMLQYIAQDREVDVVIVSEQYRDRDRGCWVSDAKSLAAVWAAGDKRIEARSNPRTEMLSWAKVEGLYIFSVYAPPRLSNEQFEALLYRLERETAGKRPAVIAGDFNAWSTVWGSRRNTARGNMLLECMASLDMCLLNTGTKPTLVRGDKTSIIDLTFASSEVAARVIEWKVLDDHTESDHRAILLTLLDEKRKKAPAPPRKWSTKSFDQETFKVAIADDRSIAGSAAEKAKKLMGLVTYACDASMSRSTPRKARPPVYWWNDDIARLREGCISARRTAQRARIDRAHYHECYKEARAELRRAIKNSKRQCWKDLVQSVDDCPWGRPYKIVMDKLRNQATPSPTDLPLGLEYERMRTRNQYLPPASNHQEITVAILFSVVS
ncbi:uncharacterized protein LOC111694380 [Trichogramma pretiosum]|uniref:uncharacterized protein LOC111694380 n=1 Tax=Trichogramma pretiosum TaxID=7493 RepID=UPI000C7190F7|nr:uncharacterized protein LOC111694380 [Trichogramma pretiosum]